MREASRLSHQDGMVDVNQYIYRQPIARLGKLMSNAVALRLMKYEGVDLGCGPYELLNKEGLDFNPKMVEAIRVRYPNSKIVEGDIFNLPYETSSLASVSMSHVLEHLAPLPKAIREVSRVLKPSGEVIFQLPTEGFLYRLAARLTTERRVKRMVGENYLDFKAAEHVNSCRYILDVLGSYFKMDTIVGIPFGIPLIEPNIFIIGRCIKE